MSNDLIVQQLRNAGIPSEALKTTLPKEGLVEMREYVDTEAYKEKRIVHIHASSTRTTQYVEKAELAFYLLAKELALMGEDVYCCDLVDIHTALFKETDEAYAIASRVYDKSSGFIAIRHFHDRGGRVDQFMTPYEIAYFTSWLIRRYQDGAGFILLGASPIMDAIDWWPASFMGYLRSRSLAFEVRK